MGSVLRNDEGSTQALPRPLQPRLPTPTSPSLLSRKVRRGGGRPRLLRRLHLLSFSLVRLPSSSPCTSSYLSFLVHPCFYPPSLSHPSIITRTLLILLIFTLTMPHQRSASPRRVHFTSCTSSSQLPSSVSFVASSLILLEFLTPLHTAISLSSSHLHRLALSSFSFQSRRN